MKKGVVGLLNFRVVQITASMFITRNSKRCLLRSTSTPFSKGMFHKFPHKQSRYVRVLPALLRLHVSRASYYIVMLAVRAKFYKLHDSLCIVDISGSQSDFSDSIWYSARRLFSFDRLGPRHWKHNKF